MMAWRSGKMPTTSVRRPALAMARDQPARLRTDERASPDVNRRAFLACGGHSDARGSGEFVGRPNRAVTGPQGLSPVTPGRARFAVRGRGSGEALRAG